MYRKVKNITEFRSLLLASPSSQNLWIKGSCEKSVCDLQKVVESPSSSQHSTVRPKRVNRERVESGRMSFLRAINTTTKIPLTLDLLIPRTKRNALERLLQF